MLALRNVLKAWSLLVVVCGALAFAGWSLDGYRLLSIFLFKVRQTLGDQRQ